MRVLLVVILLAAVDLQQNNSTLLEGSTQQELDIYKAQLRIVYNKLANECPSCLKSRRQVREDHPLRLEVVKELYERLLGMLAKCRRQNHTLTTVTAEQTTPTTTEQITPTTAKQTTLSTTKQTTPTIAKQTTPSTTKQTTPTATTQTTPTTTEQTPPTTAKQTTPATTKQPTPGTTEQTTPTTTKQITPTTTTQRTPTTTNQATPTTTEQTTPTSPQPIECQQATNYTQSWRRDYNGSDIKPGGPNSHDGYACDLHVSNSWFRFTGEAGNRMLDRCPKEYSCGTAYPYWTNAEMSNVVGVESTVDVYGVIESN